MLFGVAQAIRNELEPKSSHHFLENAKLFSDVVIWHIRNQYFVFLDGFWNDSHSVIPSQSIYDGELIHWREEPEICDFKLWKNGITWRSICLKRGDTLVKLSNIEKKKLNAAWNAANEIRIIYQKRAKRAAKAERERKELQARYA